MRLIEIIDTEFTTKQKKTPFDKEKLEKEKEAFKKKSSSYGAYGAVKTDPKDPFMAKKKYHAPMKDLDEDPYYVYIKTIHDQGLAKSNPYFPRVYNVDIEKDKTGEVRPTFQMEKLVGLDEFDEETLYALGDKMFINFEDLLPEGDKNRLYIDYNIVHQMQQAINYNNYGGIKDPQLKQALQVVDKIIESNPTFHLDLQADNFMVRPTSHGPQLVLIDPIAKGEDGGDDL